VYGDGPWSTVFSKTAACILDTLAATLLCRVAIKCLLQGGVNVTVKCKEASLPATASMTGRMVIIALQPQSCASPVVNKVAWK
jgi:hypothetical protein